MDNIWYLVWILPIVIFIYSLITLAKDKDIPSFLFILIFIEGVVYILNEYVPVFEKSYFILIVIILTLVLFVISSLMFSKSTPLHGFIREYIC